MVTQAAAFGGAVETYAYDGDGHRVQKTSPGGTTTIYVYDALGELAAEYSNIAVAPRCQTCYLSADHLGSVRLVTDQSANVISRHDYLPFGEEILAGYSRRIYPSAATNQFDATDEVTERFTGKERDTESGLDYFGDRQWAGLRRPIQV